MNVQDPTNIVAAITAAFAAEEEVRLSTSAYRMAIDEGGNEPAAWTRRTNAERESKRAYSALVRAIYDAPKGTVKQAIIDGVVPGLGNTEQKEIAVAALRLVRRYDEAACDTAARLLAI